MAKVAVASTDGIAINEHFGRAEEFLIYEVDQVGTYKLLEHRKNIPNCSSEHQDHSSDRTVSLLADVEAVLVSKIGPGANRALRSNGVFAFTLTDSIDKALKAYAKRGKILQSTTFGLAGDKGSCDCSKGCSDKSWP